MERVLLSRKTDRPVGTDYVNMLFSDFMEFHGDRLFRDDPAVAGGIAMFGNIPVTVIAQVKGKTTKENVTRNFAMMSPEGYRKTLRLIRQAEKFGRPVICIVDTPGAFCGQEAEEHGQGEAIASNLYELSSIKVPIVSVLIGKLAEAEEHWLWLWQMKCGFWKTLSIRFFLRKDLQVYSGKTASVRQKRRK